MDDKAVGNLVVAVFRAHGAIIANGNQFVADLGLSSALWQVLDALERGRGNRSVSDIARAMGLSRQSVQRSVDRLVQHGLVAFETNPAHKRAQLVVLTDEGWSVLRIIQERLAPSIADILNRIPVSDLASATRILTVFTDEQHRLLGWNA